MGNRGIRGTGEQGNKGNRGTRGTRGTRGKGNREQGEQGNKGSKGNRGTGGTGQGSLNVKLSEVQLVVFTCDLSYIASLFLRTSILRTNVRKNYATSEIYPRSCQATLSKTVALISTLL